MESITAFSEKITTALDEEFKKHSEIECAIALSVAINHFIVNCSATSEEYLAKREFFIKLILCCEDAARNIFKDNEHNEQAITDASNSHLNGHTVDSNDSTSITPPNNRENSTQTE